MDRSLLYSGSVKNLYVDGNDVIFDYSDRYSLFDWGEMPDHLEKKGEALATMGALFFKLMQQAEIPTHFIALVNEFGISTRGPSRFMKVKKVPVYRPIQTSSGYDYSFYAKKPEQGLVPLEVMFRFGIGKGSSVLPRVKKNPELLNQWNLTSIKEGDVFDFPLIDFSTKLEKGDRYLNYSEAKVLASLSDTEFHRLTSMTRKVAMVLKDAMNQLGIELWDGKIEWAFTPGHDRGFMLVDSIGLDELRLERNGQSLSKEKIREHYRQTSWYKALQEAKDKGGDFRARCTENPPHLPSELKKSYEELYTKFTDELSCFVDGKPMFCTELK